jgi:hypothetical protein
MSWNTPRTWTTSELVTASLLNTQIRDNEIELRATPQYRCYAYASGAQSVTTGPTALTLNTEIFKTATAMHDNSSGSHRIWVPTGGGGVYVAHGRATVSSANNGTAGINLYKNDSPLTPVVRHLFQTGASDWEDQELQVTAFLVLAAGEHLSLYGQTSGNAFNFTAQLVMVGPLPPA